MKIRLKVLTTLALACTLFAMHGQSMDQLVDIRPEIIKKEGDFTTGISVREQKGKKLLYECYKAHGWDKVKNIKIISAIYSDDWSIAPEALQVYNNWPLLNQKVKHDFYSFKLGYSRVELLNGPRKSEVWGVDNNIPYKQISGKISKINDANMIPALVGKEYFIQLPYWLNKVPLVNYVNDTIVNNKTYHLVYGTWKSAKANKDYDQYIYWINKETKLLEIVQYTVRVVAPGVYGFVVFDDFKKEKGVIIPFKHKLGYLPSKEGLIHEMTFESVVFDSKDVTDNEIRALTNE